MTESARKYAKTKSKVRERILAQMARNSCSPNRAIGRS